MNAKARIHEMPRQARDFLKGPDVAKPIDARSWRLPPLVLAPFLALLLLIAAPSAPAQALELILFGKSGCVWCARWEREVGQTYDQARESRVAPLRRMDIHDQRRSGIALDE